jgi:hypothetical protein
MGLAGPQVHDLREAVAVEDEELGPVGQTRHAGTHALPAGLGEIEAAGDLPHGGGEERGPLFGLGQSGERIPHGSGSDVSHRN